jgi:restriction endonuclease Mrr
LLATRQGRGLHHDEPLRSHGGDLAASVATRVILIDGERLTRLIIRYGVGVQVKRTIQIVEIDEDFFE